ncbi:MAG: hypothetical protein OEL89_00505 [Candidatus Peregrinibacteria bacterium]|nr:hypothetical protein [Candidatus Peregrinibacteria bacterium]
MTEIQKTFGPEIETFKSTITDLNLLKKLLRLASNFLNECDIELKGNDIMMRAMDSTRIIMLDMKIHEIIEDPLEIKLNFNLRDLRSILNFMKQDTLDFELDRKRIKIKNSSKSFTLQSLSLYEEDIPIESLESIKYSRIHELSWKTFKEILREAQFYSNVIEIAFDAKGLKFKNRGSHGKYNRNEGMEERDDSSTYDISLLNKVLTGTMKLFTEPFTIKIGKDVPLCIVQENSTYSVKTWIAPRVEEANFNDDEEDED